jgi:hypothetical protein
MQILNSSSRLSNLQRFALDYWSKNRKYDRRSSQDGVKLAESFELNENGTAKQRKIHRQIREIGWPMGYAGNLSPFIK